MHGVRQGRRPEDVQEQVQLPETRVPLPRGTPAESVPVSGVHERILETRQNEKPHENCTRLFHAQGRGVPADGVFSNTVKTL